MKKILLLIIASGVLFLYGCRAVHTSVEDISDTASAENDSSESSIIKKDIRINDKRLDFSSYFQLSDITLLFKNIDNTKGTMELITVSYPDFKIIKEKPFNIKTSSLYDVDIKVDKGNIQVFSKKQAIELDFDLNILKTVDFPENEYRENIVDINSDLSKILYYDNEGLKIADTDFKNTKLLFKHPQWSGDIVDSTVYSDGYFFDNDTKIFSYIDGRDSIGMIASTGMAVYNLENDKEFTKEYVLEWHGSNAMDIESTSANIVNLIHTSEKETEYNYISFDCESHNFAEKTIASIPADKLIGTPTLSNAFVGLNSRYIVYTRFDENNLPAICRYDLTTGKTIKKVFKVEDFDFSQQNLNFSPSCILPDGRVAVYYYKTDETYVVDFN